MDDFGRTLRSEREGRGLTIAGLTDKLGVERERLLALERNDLASLPDDATMMPLLRTYADCLGVEAELMIEHYLRERQRCLDGLATRIDAVADVKRTAAAPPVGRSSPFPRLLAASIVVTAVASFGLWWVFFSAGPSAPPRIERAPTAAAPAPAAAEEPTPGRALVPAAASPVAAGSPTLTVAEAAVGTGVRRLEPIGEGERFERGSQVWFWTRVEGGRRGDRVDHVWIEDGVEAARISLELGGRSWRTYSAKTLRPGSAAEWAVEARDASGNVLARREFIVVR
ncbi:MAG TPA: DUF2914 domain-containing protein [Candidatus Polarisedimenticolaceae bacterium]|nr:DUF2914 domain-containing protein [Candidatus Polarisedimenticolaceae bacterium]